MNDRRIWRGTVVSACDLVFARGMVAFAVAIPIAVALALSDATTLSLWIYGLGMASIGIAIGARIVARRVG